MAVASIMETDQQLFWNGQVKKQHGVMGMDVYLAEHRVPKVGPMPKVHTGNLQALVLWILDNAKVAEVRVAFLPLGWFMTVKRNMVEPTLDKFYSEREQKWVHWTVGTDGPLGEIADHHLATIQVLNRSFEPMADYSLDVFNRAEEGAGSFTQLTLLKTYTSE